MHATFIKRVLFLSTLASQAPADIPFTEIRGIYDATLPGQHHHSPVWGMVALNSHVIEGLRFNGNYGKLSEDLAGSNRQKSMIHPAFDACNASETIWPYDPLAAVLQHLFPSMDGAILTANQRDKDPLAELGKDLRRMNILIAEVIQIKKNIANYFLLNPRGLTQEKFKFWMQSTQQRILDILIDPTFSNLKREKKGTASPQPKLEFRYIDLVNGEYAQELPKKKLTYRQLVAARFSNVFTQSLLYESSRGSANFIYPPNFCMTALLAFTWKTSSNKNDLKSLTSLLDPDKITEDNFEFKDYEQILEYVKNSPIQQRLHPEWVILLRKGFSVYDDPIPEPITYIRTSFTDTRLSNKLTKHYYPDCGETSLRNLFHIFLSEKGVISPVYIDEFLSKIQVQGRDNLSRDFLQEKSQPLRLLLSYLNKFHIIENSSTPKAHEEWSQLISDLNTKSADSGKDKTLTVKYKNLDLYELAGKDGLQNMLNVFAHLIPDAQLNESWHKEPENYEQISQKLDRLCELFSREEFELSWKVDGSNKISRNNNLIIDFYINYRKDPAFQWNIMPYHFDVPKIFNSTSKAISHITWNHPMLGQNPLLGAWFLRMKRNLDSNSLPPQLSYLFGLNLRDVNQAAGVFLYLIRQNDTRYAQIIYKIIDDILALQDKYAWKKIGPVIYQALKNNTSVNLDNYADLGLPWALGEQNNQLICLGFEKLKERNSLPLQFLTEVSKKVINLQHQEIAEYLLSKFPNLIDEVFYPQLEHFVQGSNNRFLSRTDFLLKLLKPEIAYLEKPLTLITCRHASNPIKVLEVLFKNGLNINSQNLTLILNCITRKGVIEFIEAILDRGANITPENSGALIAAAVESLTQHNNDETLPLIEDFMESFSESSANVQSYNPSTPQEIIEFLIEKGAIITPKNSLEILASLFNVRNIGDDSVESLLTNITLFLLDKVPLLSNQSIIELVNRMTAVRFFNLKPMDIMLSRNASSISSQEYENLIHQVLKHNRLDIAHLLLKHATHLDQETLNKLSLKVCEKEAKPSDLYASMIEPHYRPWVE